MKQFLESLVKSIVENPEAVSISESTDQEGRQLLTISVAGSDMGRVIGKNGKVINAIRTILRVVAIRQGVKIRVDIEDETKSESAEGPSTSKEEKPAEEKEAEIELDLSTTDATETK